MGEKGIEIIGFFDRNGPGNCLCILFLIFILTIGKDFDLSHLIGV